MSADEYTEIHTLARSLDARFSGRVPPFSPAEDAHEAATQRLQRSAEIRNMRVREALAKLDGTADGRESCTSLLVWATWERAHIEGLSDLPTIKVGFR